MTVLIFRNHNLSRGSILYNRETDYSKNWNNNFHTTHKCNMVTKLIIQTNWRIVMYIHKLLFTMYYSEDTEPFIPIDIIQHSVSRGEEGRVKRSATPASTGSPSSHKDSLSRCWNWLNKELFAQERFSRLHHAGCWYFVHLSRLWQNLTR